MSSGKFVDGSLIIPQVVFSIVRSMFHVRKKAAYFFIGPLSGVFFVHPSSAMYSLGKGDLFFANSNHIKK